MNIRLLAEILLVVFAGTAVLVEILNRKDINPATSWISTYLTGPYSWLEDVGFLALAIAFNLFPHIFNLNSFLSVVFPVAGVAVFLTMASDKFFPHLFPSLSSGAIGQIHRASAGIAFFTASLGLILIAALPINIVLLCLCFGIIIWLIKGTNDADAPQWSEKLLAYTLVLVAFLQLKGL